ncbi:MAG: cache domain-containing protein [Dehalococcoidales bacterium]|nr:cache domain-containing protein [Dehalococcoidales bacterium]
MNRLKCTVFMCLLLTIFCGSFCACKPASQQEAEKVLDQVQQELQSAMNGLDRDLANAAGELSGLDPAGAHARKILAGLLDKRPYAVDTCTVNRNGIIVAVEPDEYKIAEGADISDQEQVIRLFRTLKPVLSCNFRSVEGIEAADMEYPVFSTENGITGSVSVLLRPEVLIRDIVSRTEHGNFSVMFMQPDGRIIYEMDADQIGRNTFVDPMYQDFPQLLELGREVSEKTSGTGYYRFMDSAVNKEAIWDTFALHGAEWRIVLMRAQ